MDALLPSEIARLVLGYLQEQKCDEAAKIFMETSPLLHECRLVSQRGGRYSTKVGGSSLTDILDKYCAANAMVQDKLNKMSDSEQLKQCNDLLEQLSYLLEGSRKRFVVNINYSSQGSPAGHFGIQNVSSSSKKRRDSESRSKRVARSLKVLMDKSSKSQANQDCNVVEVTDVDGLIKNQKSSIEQINTENERLSNQPSHVNTANNVKESRVSTLLNVNSDVNTEVTSSNVNNYCKNQAIETCQNNEITKNINKCTAGTSTEELMNYCNTEVQTCFDLFDTDSDVNSELRTEPIQNISILTQELINRKELQQRIAENINKAILPIESSLCEDGPNSSVTDMNKSKLSDLDSVIKTAVKATESDLEGILREIFDVDELNKAQPEVRNDVNNGLKFNPVPEAMDVDHGNDFEQDMQESPESVQNDQKQSSKSEIPIKQRLRSSSKCFNADEDVKDSIALIENHTAEAIMSILNCNTSKRNSLTDSEPVSENNIETNNIEVAKVSDENLPSKTETKKGTDKKCKSKKTNAKKSTVKKANQSEKKCTRKSKNVVVEEEGVPTIVLCSEVLPSKTSYVSIEPKADEAPSLPSSNLEEAPILSYRVVNVPKHLVKPEQFVMSKISNTIVQKTLQEYSVCPAPTADAAIVGVVQSNESSTPSANELITLYGTQGNDDAEVATVPSIADMPIISLDSSTIIDSEFSPFFKGSINPGEPEIVDIVVLPNSENINQPTVKPEDTVKETPKVIKEPVDNSEPIKMSNNPKQDNHLDANAKLKPDEIIAKRTPNTLLKSRSKNNRLSLSTPRRRNSHIRALDFSTPVKPSVSTNKGIQSCIKPSVCRAGLFKSPMREDKVECNIIETMAMKTTKKVRTLAPVKSSTQVSLMNVPIATRSPTTKLRGNWNKVTGIGMILNESSTGESSPEKSQSDYPTPQHQASPSIVSPKLTEENVDNNVLHKSWDSDLRKIVGNSADEEEEEKTKPKSRRKSERKSPNVKIKTKNKSDVKKEVKTDKDLKKCNSVTKTMETEKDMKNCGEVKKEVEKCDTQISSCKEDTEKNDEVQKDQKKSVNDKKNDNIKQENIVKQNKTPQIKLTTLKPLPSSTTKLTTPNQENIKITSPSDNKSKPKTTFDESSINKTHLSRNSLETLCVASQLLDLETPRKVETTICVPPTPRIFATPAQSLRKVAAVKADITIKDFVDTPEFPVTPCIVITPKIVEEENSEKRPSPYYEPSEEIMKEINEKIKVQETMTMTTIKKSVVELKDNEAVEITQFGIVEKNILQQGKLPAEDISKNDSKDTSNDTSRDTSKTSGNTEDLNSSINSSSENDEESSNDSTSSSSSSSNTSSSSASSSPESSPEKPIPDTRDVIKKYLNDNIDEPMDSPSSLMQSFSEISQEEITNLEVKVKDNVTPNKVLSVRKRPLEEVSKEKTIKDENVEAVLSKTPSVSEAEHTRDSTNKISKFSTALATASQSVSTSSSQDILSEDFKNISSKDNNAVSVTSEKSSVSETKLEQQHNSSANEISLPSTSSSQNISKSSSRDVSSGISTTDQSATNNKPKIIKIENCEYRVSKMLQSDIARVSISSIQKQAHLHNDAKLSQILEEKRLRVMAKFKGKVDTKSIVRSKKLVNEKQKTIVSNSKTTKEEGISSTNEDVKSEAIKQDLSSIEKKFVSSNDEKGIIKQEEKITMTRRSKIFQKVDEDDLKENKTVKNRSSPRKKTEQVNKKTENSSSEVNDKKRDKEARIETVTSTMSVIPAENSKGISKAKVDLVKRDLFSDEENNDQRTTRSQSTRRSSFFESQKSSEESASNDNSKLLECLQLIPANKNDIENRDANELSEEDVLDTSGSNHLDISVKYDESVPIKKRRRNYSNCELQNEYVLQMDADDDIVLKVTPYEEMFQMNPSTKSKKKIPSPKKSLTTICKKKKKKSKKGDTPITSSSPLVTSTSNKDEEEKKRKPCKRKASATEDKKMDSKSNPLSLLKKVKIEEFLKSVHEKET